MELHVFTRNVYGAPLIYPANDAARLIAELAGKKTLGQRELDLARRLGHIITQVLDPEAKVNP